MPAADLPAADLPAADAQLLARLARGEEPAFREAFERHYGYLVAVAYRYVGDQAKARDLSQDVYADLWGKRDRLRVETALRPYLRRAVVNRCLNYLKRERRVDFAAHEDLPARAQRDPDLAEAGELRDAIAATLAALPERCRVVFELSRHEQLANREIAERLGVSVKTVENQMTKALRRLREALTAGGFLTVLALGVGAAALSIVLSVNAHP